MRIIIVFNLLLFISINVSANMCRKINNLVDDLNPANAKALLAKGFEKEYVVGNPNPKKVFEVDPSNPSKKIETTYFQPDIHRFEHFEQARNAALNFPALKEMGIEFKDLKPKLCKGMPNYPESKRPCGWQFGEKLSEDGSFHMSSKNSAHVRLDFDEVKGAHFNIEVSKDGKTHKFAVLMNCEKQKCSREDMNKYYPQFGRPIEY